MQQIARLALWVGAVCKRTTAYPAEGAQVLNCRERIANSCKKSEIIAIGVSVEYVCPMPHPPPLYVEQTQCDHPASWKLGSQYTKNTCTR